MFKDTIGQFKGGIHTIFLSEEENETKLNFMIFSFIHQTHYSTAYRMFLDKPIFGHGIKMFRFLCKTMNLNQKNLSRFFQNQTASSVDAQLIHIIHICSLAETGLIGLLFLLSLLIYLLSKIIA